MKTLIFDKVRFFQGFSVKILDGNPTPEEVLITLNKSQPRLYKDKKHRFALIKDQCSYTETGLDAPSVMIKKGHLNRSELHVVAGCLGSASLDECYEEIRFRGYHLLGVKNES